MNKNQEDELVDSMAEAVKLLGQHTRAINMAGREDYKPSLWYRVSDWVYHHNPFNVSVHPASVEEYTRLPYRARHVWLFWYKTVYLQNGGSIATLFGKKSERDKMDKLLKTKYPVQFFLREKGLRLKWKLGEAKRWVSNTIRPRQKWLTKQIPNSWADKVWLIPELNFAMVVDFVDGEKCFDSTDYEGSGPAHAIFAKELKDCYDYIKVRRPKLQEEFENSYPNEETATGVFSVDYAENTRLESLIDTEDTKYLVWIVTNRNYFWT